MVQTERAVALARKIGRENGGDLGTLSPRF